MGEPGGRRETASCSSRCSPRLRSRDRRVFDNKRTDAPHGSQRMTHDGPHSCGNTELDLAKSAGGQGRLCRTNDGAHPVQTHLPPSHPAFFHVFSTHLVLLIVQKSKDVFARCPPRPIAGCSLGDARKRPARTIPFFISSAPQAATASALLQLDRLRTSLHHPSTSLSGVSLASEIGRAHV